MGVADGVAGLITLGVFPAIFLLWRWMAPHIGKLLAWVLSVVIVFVGVVVVTVVFVTLTR